MVVAFLSVALHGASLFIRTSLVFGKGDGILFFSSIPYARWVFVWFFWRQKMDGLSFICNTRFVLPVDVWRDQVGVAFLLFPRGRFGICIEVATFT